MSQANKRTVTEVRGFVYDSAARRNLAAAKTGIGARQRRSSGSRLHSNGRVLEQSGAIAVSSQRVHLDGRWLHVWLREHSDGRRGGSKQQERDERWT